MAYVLGFFFSDGTVSSKGYYARIHLQKTDQEILERIALAMGSDRPIQVRAASCLLRVDSKVIVRDLINRGCTPRKSLTLTFPEVDDAFLSHFVRGYFDGDGSIFFNKPNVIKISFSGTAAFLSSLQDRLQKSLGVRRKQLTFNRNIYVLLYYGDDARRVCSWLYVDTQDLYLKRKKQRFDDHLRKRDETANFTPK